MLQTNNKKKKTRFIRDILEKNGVKFAPNLTSGQRDPKIKYKTYFMFTTVLYDVV